MDDFIEKLEKEANEHAELPRVYGNYRINEDGTKTNIDHELQALPGTWHNNVFHYYGERFSEPSLIIYLTQIPENTEEGWWQFWK